AANHSPRAARARAYSVATSSISSAHRRKVRTDGMPAVRQTAASDWPFARRSKMPSTRLGEYVDGRAISGPLLPMMLPAWLAYAQHQRENGRRSTTLTGL